MIKAKRLINIVENSPEFLCAAGRRWKFIRGSDIMLENYFTLLWLIVAMFGKMLNIFNVANSGAGGAGGGLGREDSTARSDTGGADGIVALRYDYDPTPPGFRLLVR